jgi:hypothetical protein
MSLPELRALRAGLEPYPEVADPGVTRWSERLSDGGQAIYAFDERTAHLLELQLLGMLPSVHGLPAHFAALNAAYGTPTGIWDCPETGAVPTRRFTWRGAHATVSDVLLVHDERVSMTLFVTTNARMDASLRRAHCVPANPAALDRVPVATPEQVRALQP